MRNITHIKSHFRRLLKKIVSPFKRAGLTNRDFSIISNNCWGGDVYDQFGLEYRTPTIGLFMMADDYLRFISDLPKYLSQSPRQISFDESAFKSKLLRMGDSELAETYLSKGNDTILGKIGDVELVFVHYDSFDDAFQKWERRKKRINFNNLVYKFNDQNGCSIKEAKLFHAFPAKNKVFFTSNPEFCDSTSVFVKEYRSNGFVKDDLHLNKATFDLKSFLNSVERTHQ